MRSGCSKICVPQLFVCAMSALLAGCVPWQFSGYRPNGSGALESGYCVAGIRDRMRFNALRGVDILVYAAKDNQNQTILLEVSLVVPDGVTARFLSSDLVLRSPEWPQSRALSIYRITGGMARVHEPSAVLPGSANASTGTFTLWFMRGEVGTLWQTGLPLVRSFTVSLPPMTIDGRQFDLEEVAFRSYREWGMFTCAQ